VAIAKGVTSLQKIVPGGPSDRDFPINAIGTPQLALMTFGKGRFFRDLG
jgi:hypothetical protein